MIPVLPVLLLALTPLQEGTPEGEAPGGSNDIWVLLIALVAVFYFVMILPEKKNRKRREDMLGAMKKGDRVMTTSGMYATVAAIQEDDVITLQVADGVRVRFSRAAIQTVLADEDGGREGKDGREAKKDS